MAQTKGMAYLLVGRNDWGKSHTIMALTGGSPSTRFIDITSKKDGKAYTFFLRRTSNNDWPQKFEQFIKDLNPAEQPNLIIAFSAHTRTRNAEELLQILSAKYRLRCFVLRHRWNNPERTITNNEMALLAKYAEQDGVHDYSAQNSADTERAAAFNAYMETHTPF